MTTTTEEKTNHTAQRERVNLTISREAAKFAIQEQEGRLPKLSGYPIVWGQLTDVRGDGRRWRFLANSATAEPSTMALCNHDFAQLLGSTANGTLKITPDDYGVKIEVDPADTTYARDMIALIRRGDVAGMSFGLLLPGTSTTKDEGGEGMREFSAFSYDEVTFTAIPACPATLCKSEFGKTTAEKPAEPKAEAPPTPLRNRMAVELEEIRLALLLS